MATVYISLTTIPSKFRFLHPTINSLLNQTVQPAHIIINIPRQYSFRFDRSIPETDIATFMERYGHANLSVNRIDHDYGPGTKLLGLLENNFVGCLAEGSHLVLVDDDVIYDPGMLEMFCDAIEQEQARFASFRRYWINNIPIGQGVDGFLIDTGLLDRFPEYYDVIKNEDYVTYHDDLYVSYFFFLSGIELTFIPFKSYRFRHLGWIDALSSIEGKYSRENVRNKAIDILDGLNRHNKFDFLKSRTPGPSTRPG